MPLKFRVPFNLESGELIESRWKQWLKHDPIHLVPRYRDNLLVLVLVVGLGLWAGTMAALIVLYGWEGTFTQMGWFFTKAALLTFGGAYAVLPYV